MYLKENENALIRCKDLNKELIMATHKAYRQIDKLYEFYDEHNSVLSEIACFNIVHNIYNTLNAGSSPKCS